jgi:ABC-type glycerol-3-phosphate transport system permease component
LQPPDGISFDAYRKVLSAGDIPAWAWNSLITSVAITSAYGLQYTQNMASANLAALPVVLVFLFFQRQIIKGIATAGFGGR